MPPQKESQAVQLVSGLAKRVKKAKAQLGAIGQWLNFHFSKLIVVQNV